MTDKKKKTLKKTTSNVTDTFKFMTIGLTPEEAREEKKKKEKLLKKLNIKNLVRYKPNKNK